MSLFFSDSPRTLERAATAAELSIRPTLDSRDPSQVPVPFARDTPHSPADTLVNIPCDSRGIRPSQFQWLLKRLKNSAVSVPETVFLHKGVAQSLAFTEPSARSAAEPQLVVKGTSQQGGVLQMDPIVRDFLRLQRKRGLGDQEIALVRFLNEDAVRYVTSPELQVMLKNRRKGWMDVLLLQLLPWTERDCPLFVSYAFHADAASSQLHDCTQSSPVKTRCRQVCLRIAETLFPVSAPVELATGEFEFVHIPASDTLWLVYAHNLRVADRRSRSALGSTCVVPASRQSQQIASNVLDKQATVDAMVSRGLTLSAMLKDWQRMVHEQKLLRDVEESRSYKRASIISVSLPDMKVGAQRTSPTLPMPDMLKSYLDKYHRLRDHYLHVVARGDHHGNA